MSELSFYIRSLVVVVVTGDKYIQKWMNCLSIWGLWYSLLWQVTNTHRNIVEQSFYMKSLVQVVVTGDNYIQKWVDCLSIWGLWYSLLWQVTNTHRNIVEQSFCMKSLERSLWQVTNTHTNEWNVFLYEVSGRGRCDRWQIYKKKWVDCLSIWGLWYSLLWQVTNTYRNKVEQSFCMKSLERSLWQVTNTYNNEWTVFLYEVTGEVAVTGHKYIQQWVNCLSIWSLW